MIRKNKRCVSVMYNWPPREANHGTTQDEDLLSVSGRKSSFGRNQSYTYMTLQFPSNTPAPGLPLPAGSADTTRKIPKTKYFRRKMTTTSVATLSRTNRAPFSSPMTFPCHRDPPDKRHEAHLLVSPIFTHPASKRSEAEKKKARGSGL